jgi:DNA (cytosine-5)-methyltransferase 1
MNFYNEFDKNAAAWIKNLVARKHIPDGVVDERSITEVCAKDIVGYRQCHWFCGIAGWAEAFRLAGISNRRGAWSASLPCQPLSSAGKQRGAEDERHLWPEFYRLVSECGPAVIFGEQSGSKLGREWLDGISLDLEELGYAVASSDLSAASVGAPHIRQRIYWGAIRLEHASGNRWQQRWTESGGRSTVGRCGDGGLADTSTAECDWWDQSSWQHGRTLHTADSGKHGGLADTEHDSRRAKHVDESGRREPQKTDTAERAGVGRMGNTASNNERGDQQRRPGPAFGISTGGSGPRLGNAIGSGLEGHAGHGNHSSESRRLDEGTVGSVAETDPWGDWYTVLCRDGKTRRIGTSVQPLVDGVPRSMGSLQSELERMGVDAKRAASMRKWAGSRLAKTGRNRVGRLRGYGNAIVPPLAAVFIRMFLQSAGFLQSSTELAFDK